MAPTGRWEMKVPGGKLFEVRALHDSVVRKVELTGDFFLIPEEAIDALEASLAGLPLPLDEDEALRRIEEAISATGARMVGISPEDVVLALSEAVG